MAAPWSAHTVHTWLHARIWHGYEMTRCLDSAQTLDTGADCRRREKLVTWAGLIECIDSKRDTKQVEYDICTDWEAGDIFVFLHQFITSNLLSIWSGEVVNWSWIDTVVLYCELSWHSTPLHIMCHIFQCGAKIGAMMRMFRKRCLAGASVTSGDKWGMTILC